MATIKLFNKISSIGIDRFDLDKFTLSEDCNNYDGIMVRSAALHDVEFPESLLAIARAGAGVNNIPVDKCAEKGIVVFNTPGANANGVKELAIASLFLASRNISGGIKWVDTLKGQDDVAKLVEKGKSAFVGPEIAGKTLGVIGLGAIGGMVANAASALGMNVIGCDPYLTVNAAWSISRAVRKANTYDEIYASADYITVHIPATPETKNTINAETISKMKDGVRIINLSRGDIVNTADMIAALEIGKVASYVTDFPCDELIGVKGAVLIPHLGASTPESEDNCAVIAADELIDYIENGNIRFSVNYPAISQPRTTKHRLIALHENAPNMLAQIANELGEDNINIDSMTNRSKGNYAASIFDTDSELTEQVVEDVKKIKGIIRVRVI